MQSNDAAIGTLWAFSHEQGRQFDSEDARLLSKCARFASAACLLENSLEITEKTQQERAVLRHLLIVAEEEERKRLSRELHDEAGQRLASLILGLQLLVDEAGAGSPILSRAATLQSEAVALSKELHGLAVRLRPAALDDFGLEAAILTYAVEWSTRSGIHVDKHLNLHGRVLPTDISAAIYRVVQEALTNIARHSGGTLASILLSDNQHEVILVVEDNGQGMAETAASESIGIRGMTERVALLGGTIDFETASTGTSIYVRIPLP